MSSVRKDLTGKRFNKFTVLTRDTNKKSKSVYYTCRCDCGITKSISYANLVSGEVKSCGCHRKSVTQKLGQKSRGKGNPMYGSGRTGETNPNWRGGRYIDSAGYIYCHTPDHPNATKAGYIFEHRLVVEQRIGRYLLAEEVVHHINGKKGDNRSENLMLFASSAEHQKFHKDLIIVSNNIIKFIETDIRAIVRINLAWENTEEKINKIFNMIRRPIFLDFPLNRKKYPLPEFDLEVAIRLANEHTDLVKYFAFSNAEERLFTQELRKKLDRKIRLVPKIESEKGINNFEEICRAAATNLCMLDREDLFRNLNYNLDKTKDLLTELYIEARKMEITILELQGIVFSTFDNEQQLLMTNENK